MKNVWYVGFTIGFWGLTLIFSTVRPAAATPLVENPDRNSPASEALDLSPETLEGSPVLQRWLQEIPDVWDEISSDPSFPTRVRLGYIRLADGVGGWNVGIEDVFIDRSRLVLGGAYEQTGDDDRSFRADLGYYLLPLGSYVNFAPVVGYRYLQQEGDIGEGVNVGFRIFMVLSRGGGSDLSISHMWMAPLSNEEVSLTTLRAAYALTRCWRISTDLQRQDGEGRIGIFLEWMP
ncbi:MAG: hypothetical protein WBB29_20175 [Geitlerinemataceae cyanobacterium]